MIQKQKTQAIKSILVAWVFCFSELYFFCRVLDIRVSKIVEPDRPQAMLRKQAPKPVGERIRPHGSAVSALEHRSGVVPGLALVPVQQRLQVGRQRERPAACAGFQHLGADHAAAAGLVMLHHGVVPDMQLSGVKVDILPAEPADLAAAQPVGRGQQHRQIQVGAKADGHKLLQLGGRVWRGNISLGVRHRDAGCRIEPDESAVPRGL